MPWLLLLLCRWVPQRGEKKSPVCHSPRFPVFVCHGYCHSPTPHLKHSVGIRRAYAVGKDSTLLGRTPSLLSEEPMHVLWTGWPFCSFLLSKGTGSPVVHRVLVRWTVQLEIHSRPISWSVHGSWWDPYPGCFLLILEWLPASWT